MKISKNQSLVLAVSIIALFFVIGILFMPKPSKIPVANLPQQTPTAAPTPEPGVTPSQESKFMLKEFQRAEIREGRKVWEAKGSQGQYFPENNTAKVLDAKVWMFQKDGKVVVLSAGEALLRMQGVGLKGADATKGVVIVYDDKETLETESLSFDKENDRIHAPGHVQITGAMIDISGEELEGKLQTNDFILKKNVSTVIKPKAKKNED